MKKANSVKSQRWSVSFHNTPDKILKINAILRNAILVLAYFEQWNSILRLVCSEVFFCKSNLPLRRIQSHGIISWNNNSYIQLIEMLDGRRCLAQNISPNYSSLRKRVCLLLQAKKIWQVQQNPAVPINKILLLLEG